MNEITNEVQYISDKAIAILKQYDMAEEKVKELSKQVDAVKKALYKNMEKNGVKSFETDEFKFTIVSPKDGYTINTEKMKDEGTYDYYCDKLKHTSGYVKYTKKKKKAVAE